jgi:gamma-glutamylcyclotransferase (GGCT)/AIG2-like uncharacterized protein YtfP
MYDCGWYPGVRLGGKGCNSSFVVECIEVDADRLKRIDGYEGYRENDPVTSLYLRKPLAAVIDGETIQGWIYTYNHEFDSFKFVESGDWLKYTGEKKGLRSELASIKQPEPVLAEERAAK